MPQKDIVEAISAPSFGEKPQETAMATRWTPSRVTLVFIALTASASAQK